MKQVTGWTFVCRTVAILFALIAYISSFNDPANNSTDGTASGLVAVTFAVLSVPVRQK